MRTFGFQADLGTRRLPLGTSFVALTLLLLSASMTAAMITVTSTADNTTVDGAVTLREAIVSINNGANLNADVVAVGAYGTADTIVFSIGTGVQTISLFQLPTITKPVVINGTTQPGFSGTPLIVLDGNNGSSTRGLTIAGGSSTVRGLDIIRFGVGIELTTAGGNTIVGNFIGINAAGTTAAGNDNFGILVSSGSNNNVIGGTTAADRNVISGNFNNDLIFVQTGVSGTVIEGNYIGTNAAGTAAVAAGGIAIDISGTDTTIGGTVGTTPGGPCTGACNLISGKQLGVIFETGSTGGQVQGNLIGTNAAGTAGIPNGIDGVLLNESNHTVGGTTASARNVIAFNSNNGVTVTDNGAGNAILGNSIFSNGGLGINLGPTGVTPNDAGDADTGANNLQNFPRHQLGLDRRGQRDDRR